MSHGVCRPVSDSVLGQTIDGPDDIRREFAAAGARPQVVDVPFGGHGFEVRARDARQADEYARVADAVSQWLDTLQPAIIG